MKLYCISCLAGLLMVGCFSQETTAQTVTPASGAKLQTIYKWLHQNPELSFREQKTAGFLVTEMKSLGFDVSEGLGNIWVHNEIEAVIGKPGKGLNGYGVVAIFRNGDGPKVLIRTDMDALPVKEETGLAYASTYTSMTLAGVKVPVMHACGHDIHMANWIGTARHLIAHKSEWSGTLIMLAQPAEEWGLGALSMISDGAFDTRFLPDYNLAFHVSDSLPAGKIGYAVGPAMASISSVDITVKGVGGHGAYPHKTKDPIVIAAHIVTALQTLVSRTIDPRQPAVVTVGSIVSGTKRNIISNEATMLLTVRTYDDETRKLLLDGITRIAEGQAATFGAPKPEIRIAPIHTPAVLNEAKLTSRAVSVLSTTLGSEALEIVQPVMSGEDYARYSQLGEGIPSLLLWLGVVPPEAYSAANGVEGALPSLHSSKFAPDVSAIETGVTAMSAIAIDLFTMR
ncbi:MAG: peptidase M20 [Alphaproteobacteria bacterium]|nr:MAG: peptidase M20 [Alphaproteobacteria bacterium]